MKDRTEMLRVVAGLFAAVLPLLAASAPASDRAGDFDYYVLALSWTPSWCAREGDSRGAPVCRDGAGRGFVLHGLWPQHRDGWPEYCASAVRDPLRRETAAMADVMGSPGLAWHQWKKHGRCSGLSSRDYFALSRRAFESVARPEILRRVDRVLRIDPGVVEEAFLAANPGIGPESVTVTCRSGAIAEVRICLSRSLSPTACTGPAARGCSRPANLPPMR